MNRFTPVVTVFSVLLLSGCGGSDGEDFTSAGLNTFNGSWSNGCEIDPDTGTGDTGTITINGSDASAEVSFYSNSTCTGTPLGSGTVNFNISYTGEIALSDCFNGQKVEPTLLFPLIVNGATITEAQYNALPADDRDVDIISAFDLLCTNEAGTILYSGDTATGDGSSDATRPTSADLTEGINKVL